MLNGLGITPWSEFSSVRVSKLQRFMTNAVASARGTRPKLLYVRVGSGTICSEWT